MIQPFSAAVRSQGGVAILDLQGEINAFADQELREAYAAAESLNPVCVALGFEKVSYINSTGIALIVGLLMMARKSNRRMIAYGLSDHYKEIFQITRLTDFIEVHPDEANALRSAAQWS